jgi:hypothetical protein
MICYVICNDPPKLNALLATTTINKNGTMNVVVPPTEEPNEFKHVLPAKYGGFYFIF